MTSYQERKERTKVYVLSEGEKVLGVFTNLKKLTEFMKDKDFPSYSKISKMNDRNLRHNSYIVHHINLT